MPKPLLAAAAAVALLSAGFAATPAVAESGFKDSQKQEIRKIIREYLIKNPEVIVEAMQEMRKRQREARLAASRKAIIENKDALLRNKMDPIGGNKSGNITLIEFFDYNCGWCKRTTSHMKAALKADGNVRVVYKEFPILAPSSRMAAQAALAARNQGKYQEMHDGLMAARGALDETKIMAIAEKIGLDLRKLKTDMRSPEVEAAIASNLALARKLNIQGTPAFIVGGRLIPGFMRAGQFIQEFNRTRKACSEKKTTFC